MLIITPKNFVGVKNSGLYSKTIKGRLMFEKKDQRWCRYLNTSQNSWQMKMIIPDLIKCRKDCCLTLSPFPDAPAIRRSPWNPEPQELQTSRFRSAIFLNDWRRPAKTLASSEEYLQFRPDGGFLLLPFGDGINDVDVPIVMLRCGFCCNPSIL